ncbi:MAG: glycoside hydrolase family 130 protein [Alicyclobacillaceae bacterium]|nr:glycoside hydrolase family 130 protein [Alicyclobacillaceae bacterium]
MRVYRYEQNPLITPKDVKPLHEGFEVIGAFNAGIARLGDEIIMLLRVAERPPSDDVVRAPVFDPVHKRMVVLEFNRLDDRYDLKDPRAIVPRSAGEPAHLTSISYLRIARSPDGRHFQVDDHAFLYPETSLETFGLEDPRIAQIGDTYYITYSSVSENGVGVGLVSTRDFQNVVRHGLIFPPENKDTVLFPDRIGGKYYALHRPVPCSLGKPEIWIAESDNLLQWGNHRHLLGCRHGHWDSRRIGAGTVPIRTEMGWLELYHGADQQDRYCMGAVLLDLNDPGKVIARSEEPILLPEAAYERDGFFGNVVFSCGALVDGDVVRLYYGVADTSMACAELSLQEILRSLH